MNQTLAQFLGIKKFPFRVYDSNGNRIYYENLHEYWFKKEFDYNNNATYYENSCGDWYEQKFDSNNNLIYYKDSDGNKEIYRAPCEDKVVEIEGVKYKLKKYDN